MEGYYIFVTSEDVVDRDSVMMHTASPPRQSLSSRHPLASTRASSSQSQARASRAQQQSQASSPPQSSLFSPARLLASSTAFAPMGLPDSSSLDLSNLFGSMPSPANAMPNPFTPSTHRSIFSQAFPLGGQSREGAASTAADTGVQSGAAARSGTAEGADGAVPGSSQPLNPLEEILQRAFSHVSAESFISEFVRRSHAGQPRCNPPASQFAIDNLVVEGDPITDSCAICQDDISERSKCLHMPCKHAYHRTCILRWLAEHNTCPVCRCEIESHCPQYNQANFDKLKGKLGKVTISNHEDPSKMEPPATDHLLFGPPPPGGSAAGPTRTLRMTLRMPVGTLSWLSGPETPPTTSRQRSSARSSSARTSAAAAAAAASARASARAETSRISNRLYSQGTAPMGSRSVPPLNASAGMAAAAAAAAAQRGEESSSSSPAPSRTIIPGPASGGEFPGIHPFAMPPPSSSLSGRSAILRAMFDTAPSSDITALHTRRTDDAAAPSPTLSTRQPPSPAAASARRGTKRRRTEEVVGMGGREAVRQRSQDGGVRVCSSGGGQVAQGAERGAAAAAEDATPVSGRTRRRVGTSRR